ncbi:MAG: (deoxy)nucleoside triphosphate pyrophosphohydrolase [Planctomycetaceae bacterium]
MPPPKPIAVAIVAHADQVLVGVRGDDGPLPGFAEFPGGKCQPGEAPADGAVRECGEETGLRVEIVELLDRRTFDYPHGSVDLHFFLCRLADAREAVPRHRSFRWVAASELRNLNFPPANATVVELLATRPLHALSDPS